MIALTFTAKPFGRTKHYEHASERGRGAIFYLPGSRKWECRFSARKGDGVVFVDAQGGTPDSCARNLAKELDRRSIGLWGADETVTVEIAR